jgi:hypothetical protein
MKYILTIFVFGVLVQAQDFTHHKSIFLSGGAGINGSSSSNEINLNKAPDVLLFGSLGIPLTIDLSFYNRLSYSLRSNFLAYEIGPANQLVQTNASFSQLIYNSGLRYRIYSNSRWGFALSTGFTYSLVNQQSGFNGEISGKIENQSFYGYFGGADLEYKFQDSNITMFGEAQYNHIGTNSVYYRDKFSGMNFAVGLRYYLQK